MPGALVCIPKDHSQRIVRVGNLTGLAAKRCQESTWLTEHHNSFPLSPRPSPLGPGPKGGEIYGHILGNPHTLNRKPYRGTSLMRTPPLLGPYSRTIPRVVWWSYREGEFLMGEVPLYTRCTTGS